MAARTATQLVRPTTMHAIVQDTYGGSEVLRSTEVDVPDIADDEVLVQVRAAGVSMGTWHLMTGQPYLMRIMGFGLRRPKIPVPGQDVAGVVVEVGADVTRFRRGDEVYGIARGAFAEYAAASQDKLAHKPTNLGFAQAAVVPVSAITAFQALRDKGQVKAGQEVLVIGASGGVGTFAVQLAKALGANVTGVASTAKVDLVASLGADRVIDYTRQDFADGSGTYDLILDIAGNSRLSRLRRALKPGGTLVIVGGEEGGKLTGGFGRTLRAPILSLFVGHRLVMHTTKERSADLDLLRPLLESGQVTPALEATYPLAEAPAALRHLETGQVRGKVAITP